MALPTSKYNKFYDKATTTTTNFNILYITLFY